MMSAGFQWGVNNNNLHNKTTPSQNSSLHNNFHSLNQIPRSVSESILSNQKKKRRLDEEEEIIQPTQHQQYNFPSTTNFHALNTINNIKKTKTSKIIGQPLPTTRIIETLNQTQLQDLINKLVDLHPELHTTIKKISNQPSMKSLTQILEKKFEEIINHLPYKGNIENDYSYLRIKPYLIEFLNCLEDYILSILPPIQQQYEENKISVLEFLNDSTKLIHKLPNFKSSEFQYKKQIIYENLINIWFLVLTNLNDEFYQFIVEFKLIEVLECHCKFNKNFGKLIEFINDKLKEIGNLEINVDNNQVNSNGNSSGAGNSLNDLITIDYSQYSI
ncbi:STS1 [Candida jiufengensis]|uniref:STS1 n=1 Tax=Candida jiufengensis TaxID=497108 RepID=UPI00222486FD|nr:STS1 [Candida jiufengensis]KAI5951172.1 STS1 [Candida jiufengensis]